MSIYEVVPSLEEITEAYSSSGCGIAITRRSETDIAVAVGPGIPDIDTLTKILDGDIAAVSIGFTPDDDGLYVALSNPTLATANDGGEVPTVWFHGHDAPLFGVVIIARILEGVMAPLTPVSAALVVEAVASPAGSYINDEMPGVVVPLINLDSQRTHSVLAKAFGTTPGGEA